MSDVTARPVARRVAHVFPDQRDTAHWHALTAAEQVLLVEGDEEAGFLSGEAPSETLEQRLARVRGS